MAWLSKCFNFNKPCNFKGTFLKLSYKSGGCCQQLCRRKSKQEAAFWQIVNERCPQKGVVLDEIDPNCGIVNRVSIYVSVYFEGGGRGRL